MKRLNPQVVLTPQQVKERMELIQALAKEKDVQAFLQEHDLDESFLQQHVGRLQSYVDQRRTCAACKGLSSCPYQQKGVYRDLELVNGRPADHYRPCPYATDQQKRYRHVEQYKYCKLSKELYDADLYHMDLRNESADYIELLNNLLSWLAKEDKKGIYFYGGFGVGKTYLAACLSNALAKQGRTITFVNTTDFCNELRNSYRGSDNIPLVEAVQRMDVLVLDDIGAETVTDWIRDSVLYPMLNDRMVHHRLTLFTSNLNYEELMQHYSINNNGVQNRLNAERLLDRIRCLSDLVFVKGKNRRF